MVILFFNFDGGRGHEADGVGKVGKCVFTVKLPIKDFPLIEFTKHCGNLRFGKKGHTAIIERCPAYCLASGGT